METTDAMRRIGVVRRMRRGLDGLAKRLSRRAGRLPVAVERRDGGFVVRADMPGYDRRDIAVTAYRDAVRIVAGGERTGSAGDGSREDRPRPRVERTVELPAPIDEFGAVAEFRDGTLTIRVAERRPHVDHAVPVRAGSGEMERAAVDAERPTTDAERPAADAGEVEEAAAGDGDERRSMGPSDEEIREYEARTDGEFDRQRDLQRDKSGRQYRRK